MKSREEVLKTLSDLIDQATKGRAGFVLISTATAKNIADLLKQSAIAPHSGGDRAS